MTRKWILLGFIALTVIPACTHPLDRVIQERAEVRQASLEANGRISSGACDDVGQMIAQDRSAGLSVITEASAAPVK